MTHTIPKALVAKYIESFPEKGIILRAMIDNIASFDPLDDEYKNTIKALHLFTHALHSSSQSYHCSAITHSTKSLLRLLEESATPEEITASALELDQALAHYTGEIHDQ